MRRGRLGRSFQREGYRVRECGLQEFDRRKGGATHERREKKITLIEIFYAPIELCNFCIAALPKRDWRCSAANSNFSISRDETITSSQSNRSDCFLPRVLLNPTYSGRVLEPGFFSAVCGRLCRETVRHQWRTPLRLSGSAVT